MDLLSSYCISNKNILALPALGSKLIMSVIVNITGLLLGINSLDGTALPTNTVCPSSVLLANTLWFLPVNIILSFVSKNVFANSPKSVSCSCGVVPSTNVAVVIRDLDYSYAYTST